MRAIATRATVKNAAAGLLCAAGLDALARRRHRDALAILMFHGVEDRPPSPPCWHVSGAALFRRQLRYVRAHFNVLALEDALDRLAGGTLPPRRCSWRPARSAPTERCGPTGSGWPSPAARHAKST
ncbi:hypothetical protein MOKP101_17680 [Mycobacterium avium subsp. hominissuis]